MKFNIPKQHKPIKERIDIKLETSLVAKLDRFCEYLESDRDYVISTVLQVAFKKHQGFAEWLRSRSETVSEKRPTPRATA